METEILKELGLKETEINVYLHILKNSPCLASEVSKGTGLNRSHTYDIIKNLVEKSIISYVIRENRKYFQATNPEQLNSLLKEQQEKLKKSEQKLNSLINELKQVSSVKKQDLIVSVYEGKKGFQTLLEDILKQKKEYLVLGYNPKADEYLQYFIPGFYKRRLKTKIKRKAIVDPNLKGSWVQKQKLQEIRFFKYKFPMGIIIYSNKVVMTIIQENNQIAIVIQNKKIADNFKQLFKSIWEQSER